MVQRVRRHEIEIGLEHEFRGPVPDDRKPWVFDPDGLGAPLTTCGACTPGWGTSTSRPARYEGFTANIAWR